MTLSEAHSANTAEMRGREKSVVEAQQRDGWYCWGCAKWLPAGEGVIVTRWPKYERSCVGLYCDKKCAP